MKISNPLNNKKVLITCGPTWVPIDDMRIISNRSTGSLGQLLAKAFVQSGANVTVLEGPVDQRLKLKSLKIIPYHFFDELFSLLKDELTKNYDIIIHAAAISDYQLKKPFKAKINSDQNELTLTFKRTPKIIEQIKKINPNIFLVGFKLESKMTESIAREESAPLFKKSKCDLVVANSITNDKYNGFILDKESCLTTVNSRADLAKNLIKALKAKL